MGKIPDRWQEYEAIGRTISGTRFVAFKVPLNENILRQMEKSDWFTVDDLITRLGDNGLTLGLVIDLTNTTRYYRKEEIERQDIEYYKIFTEGHVVPSKQVRQGFFEIVDDFLERNKDNEKIIGIHCTHGLNRTGYLVCRYMIDRLNISPKEAIEAFNVARGHEMERENYLNDLLGKPPTSSPAKNPSSSPRRGGARDGRGGGARGGRGGGARGGWGGGGARQNGGTFHGSNEYHHYDNARGSSHDSQSTYNHTSQSVSYDNGSYDSHHHNSSGYGDPHNSYQTQPYCAASANRYDQSTSYQHGGRFSQPEMPSWNDQQGGYGGYQGGGPPPEDSWHQVSYRKRSPRNSRAGDWFDGVRNQSFSGGRSDRNTWRNDNSRGSQSSGRSHNSRRAENWRERGGSRGGEGSRGSGASRDEGYGQFGRRHDREEGNSAPHRRGNQRGRGQDRG